MKNPKLFFLIFLALGLSYLVFFLVLSHQVYSGFIMQLIFLVSGNPVSLGQTLAGLLWVVLLLRFCRALVRLAKNFSATQKLVRSLRIIRITPQYFVFKSTHPTAFTAGFLRPRIYLSSVLLRISTADELASIVHHESLHQSSHDPLKELSLGFIFDLIPPIPFKSWLFGQYQTLVEITCDTFSQARSSSPHSLLSALVKIQEFNPPQPCFVSHFSAQSERIKILTGQKTQNLYSLASSSLFLASLFVVAAFSLSRFNLFYQCRHLFQCFQNLTAHSQFVSRPVYLDNQCHLL